MTTMNDDTRMAGAHAPAISISGKGAEWRVELWPHRSLSRRGFHGFLILLCACFGIFFLMTALAPSSDTAPRGLATVLLVVLPFIIACIGAVYWAFRRNYADGTYRERVSLIDGELIVEAWHPRRPARRWAFQPYWTRIRTRTTREIENQLIISQNGRGVAIGAFLSPEERVALCGEIEGAMRRMAGAKT